MALPLRVPGQLPIFWNDVPATTVTGFTIQSTRSSAVQTGFAGNFAKAEGVAQFSFSFDAPPLVKADGTGGWQIPAASLKAGGTLSFYIGNQEYRLTGASVNDKDLRAAQQQGGTSSSFRGNALNMTPEM